MARMYFFLILTEGNVGTRPVKQALPHVQNLRKSRITKKVGGGGGGGGSRGIHHMLQFALARTFARGEAGKIFACTAPVPLRKNT